MYLANQIEAIKKESKDPNIYDSEAYVKIYKLLKNSNFNLEEIDWDIKKSDNIIANKYPGIFKYKYDKYVTSISYLKGTVYIFNMTYNILNKESIVKYNLHGLMPDEAIQDKNYDIFKNLKKIDNTWDIKIRKFDSDDYFIALYFTDDCYLVNNIPLTKQQIEETVYDFKPSIYVNPDEFNTWKSTNFPFQSSDVKITDQILFQVPQQFHEAIKLTSEDNQVNIIQFLSKFLQSHK